MEPTVERKYTIELTADQLKALSGLVGAAGHWKNHWKQGLFDKVETEVFWKVSDAMKDYYDDNGITS